MDDAEVMHTTVTRLLEKRQSNMQPKAGRICPTFPWEDCP